MTQDLTTKAMLVKLSISQWTAKKHDKNATATVETHYAAHEAGRFNKVLVAQEAIKAVGKTANAARTFHYENTLPWTDEGYRILPATNFDKYSTEMRTLRADFDKAVEVFIADYPSLVSDARIRLNGLFNEADYPDTSNIHKKFSFGTEINPLPMGSDFRVSLNSQETDRIRSEIEARTQAGLEAAHNDLYRRLADVVKHMAEKLSDTDAIFRDSLVENVCDLVNLIPKLDITGDSQLEKLRKEAEEKLCRIPPDMLREDKATRLDTAKNAESILSAMAGMYQA